MLHIYNSYTQQKELFKPLVPGEISLYVCGLTVYDDCHIGHARMLVAFDVITRYLRASGFKVKYVRNITDIDDKIIKRAQEANESYQALTTRIITRLNEDLAALGILPPTIEPRATNYIDSMINLITVLVAKGYAYVASNGDVCYQVSRFLEYGQLAHQDVEKLRVGARVAVTVDKHDPLDFVLWKLAKPGEPSWPSPWGEGRPGWHIECSAMAIDCLGKHFDLHGGGADLIFPHHQNEIAQSEAATGEKFVNTWLHVGFVQVEKEKMSKSLGNFFTIRDVLDKHSAETIRYFLLASHYRSPINYSTENLLAAHHALERLYVALRDVEVGEYKPDNYTQRFYSAMDDDFNTPEALAVLFDLAREINRLREEQAQQAGDLAATLKYLAGVLGLLQQDPMHFLQAGTSSDEVAQIEALIAARNRARQSKSWAEADRIRHELVQLGIDLEDSADGTRWRRR